MKKKSYRAAHESSHSYKEKKKKLFKTQSITIWNSYQQATKLVIDTDIFQIIGNK